MSTEDSGEKTEEATPQKREDFRKKGQVAQSKELASALTLLAVILLLWALSQFYLSQTIGITRELVGEGLVEVVRKGTVLPLALKALNSMFVLVAPVFVVVFFIALLSSFLQVGFLVNEEALQLKWERLDPIAGMKKLFSLRNGFEGLKSLFKLVLVSFCVYLVMRSEISGLPYSTNFNVEQVFAFFGSITMKLFLSIAFLMTFISGVDYLFQKYDLEQKMKMSKQEIKEEVKSREGDPLIKARVRRIQREMAQKRMMEAVPTADVVVTNPTHIAVALKYSTDMMAPTVVAMGADLVAEKIKALAKENEVPVIENKPLARTMFKTLKIGQVIPRELYSAVAEVLSYVFKLKRKRV